MNHEGHQGVLAIRQGEYRSYMRFRYHPDPPKGGDIFAVCFLDVPLPPEPRSEDAVGLTVVAAFMGAGGKWGWIAVEKDTKTMICEDMEKDCVRGEWYWLLLSKENTNLGHGPCGIGALEGRE